MAECEPCQRKEEPEPKIYFVDDVREARRHWNVVFNLLNGALNFVDVYLEAGLPPPDPGVLKAVCARFDKLRERLR